MGPCPVREQCLRHPERTAHARWYFTGKLHKPESHSAHEAASIHRKRMIRPTIRHGLVFGNLRYNKGLIDSRCADRPKSMGSGSCFAWSTISRSWRITATLSSKGKNNHFALRYAHCFSPGSPKTFTVSRVATASERSPVLLESKKEFFYSLNVRHNRRCRSRGYVAFRVDTS